jgi:hypothetical protein
MMFPEAFFFKAIMRIIAINEKYAAMNPLKYLGEMLLIK